MLKQCGGECVERRRAVFDRHHGAGRGEGAVLTAADYIEIRELASRMHTWTPERQRHRLRVAVRGRWGIRRYRARDGRQGSAGGAGAPVHARSAVGVSLPRTT